jgi:hypothetical protein
MRKLKEKQKAQTKRTYRERPLKSINESGRVPVSLLLARYLKKKMKRNSRIRIVIEEKCYKGEEERTGYYSVFREVKLEKTSGMVPVKLLC